MLSEYHNVKMAFNGPSDISPLAHVDFAIPNFGIQECVDDKNMDELEGYTVGAVPVVVLEKQRMPCRRWDTVKYTMPRLS